MSEYSPKIGSPPGAIAEAWQEAGRKSPLYSTPASCYRCAIESCRSIAFVALKTSLGLRGLCFKHFEEVERLAGQRPSGG